MTSALVCDVWELSRRRGSIEGALALHSAPRLAGQLADAVGALRYRLSGLVDELGRPAAVLELQGRVRARCDRCGGPVEVPIDERAQFFFVTNEEELGKLVGAGAGAPVPVQGHDARDRAPRRTQRSLTRRWRYSTGARIAKAQPARV